MKRIRGFRILVLPREAWSHRRSDGQWRLEGNKPSPGSEVYSSWHRCWNDALALCSKQLASPETYNDVVVVATQSSIVLAALSPINMESEHQNELGESQWNSSRPKLASQPDMSESHAITIHANFNKTNIVWVSMTGAVYDVPCRLGPLERRARNNPDGFYGRLLAFKNELRDYFRRG